MIETLANIDGNLVDTALWAIPLGAGALALVAYAFIWWRKDRGVEGVADALGLPFAWRAPCGLEKTGLDFFNKWDDPKVSNQISGVAAAGAAGRFFDYDVYGYSGGKRRKYMFTAALFEFKEPRFPAFTLRPEGIFDKFKELFGWDDIDIPGAREFSEKYHLAGKDGDAVRAFWTPERAAGFRLPARCTAEAAGRWLVFYRYAVSVDAKAYPAFIEEARAAVEAAARG
jgi:hypothetical protein